MTKINKEDFISTVKAMTAETNLLRKSISSELTPNVDKLRMISKEDLCYFKDAYMKFKTRNTKSFEKVSFILRGGLEKLGEDRPLNSQIVDLFFYLGLIESLGNCYVDILVMIIITNGRDFHIESRYSTPRIKHVISVDDLETEKVPLTVKLNFLKGYGLVSFTKVIDSKLRNDIAHLNFELVDDKVLIRGKPVDDIVHKSFDKFMVATSVVDELLHNLATDFGWEEKHKSIVNIEEILKQFSDKKDIK